jgi:hypothetical protein
MMFKAVCLTRWRAIAASEPFNAEMREGDALGDKAPRNGRRDSEQNWDALTCRMVRQTGTQMLSLG